MESETTDNGGLLYFIYVHHLPKNSVPYTSLAHTGIGTQLIMFIIQMFIELLLCQALHSAAKLNQIYWSLSQLMSKWPKMYRECYFIYVCLPFLRKFCAHS